MNLELIRLRREAIEADAAWSAELRARFGKRAGDVRYTPLGRKGEPLASLCEAKIKASEAAHQEWLKTL